MAGKLYLTKVSDSSKVTAGSPGDYIELNSDGQGGIVVHFQLGSNGYDFHGSDFKADSGTPQEYAQTPTLTVRFKDFFNNVYKYTLSGVGDKVSWSNPGGSLWLSVTVGGTSHSFPAGFQEVDTTSDCGTA